MASELEHQLSQLDELLGLLDANALRTAQEALEHQIAELTERLEVTRQALTQAQAQRRRLARARLLLEESSAHEHANGNSDPALRPAPLVDTPSDEAPPTDTPAVPASVPNPLSTTAPFVAERRQNEDRRSNGERRGGDERRKNPRLP